MMSLCHYSTFYSYCVSTANTSPEIHTFVYSVCEDTPIGTFVCEILKVTLILVLCYYSSTGAIHIYRSLTDVSTGDTAFHIDASDAEGKPLTYSLTGPNAGFFTVDRNTGRVSVYRQLDREVRGGGFNDAFYQYLKSHSQMYSFMFSFIPEQ